MFKTRPKHKPSRLKNQNGQTFLEFIFILMILVTISFAFLRGFSYLIGTRWEIMLKIIARPNQDTIQLPQ
jgi:hypothetical protein